jgi:hypothetical protein
MLIGPIPSLVLARLRRRAGTTVLTVSTVVAATTLIAVVSGIGLLASDATLARAMAPTGADRPVVRVSHYSISNRDAAAAAGVVRTSLAEIGPFIEPAVRGAVFRQRVDQALPIVDQVLAVDDAEPLTRLIEGRFPEPCLDGRVCEAVLLSEAPIPESEWVARPVPGLELRVVGRGLIDDAIPFGRLDQRGPVGERVSGGTYQTGAERPALLLVVGLDAMAASTGLEQTGRTYVWTAPLRPSAIHPWTLATFQESLDTTSSRLLVEDQAFSVASPIDALRAELTRARASQGRLILVEALGIAILLAFAVFLGLVVRADVADETARLTAAGALGRHRLAFWILEAGIPAGVGAVLGVAAGAALVAWLTMRSGSEVGPVLAGSVLSPDTIVGTALALVLVAGAIVLAAGLGGWGRGTVRVIAAIGVTTVVLVGWQLVISGSLGASGLASAVASPVVVLLPPAIAFLLALTFLLVLPRAMRILSGRLRRGPLPVRLSLVSVARDPVRSAATLTLLALSMGAIVFAMGWSASLRRGIDDGAAYRTGLDLRVTELGTGLSLSPSVVPVDRYTALGEDLTIEPVLRDSSPSQPGGPVEIVGIRPDALRELDSWRADFSALPRAELATRLELPEPGGGWRMSGHQLAADEGRLVLDLSYDGDPLKLDAIVVTDGGDAASIPLGVVTEGMTQVSAPLPAEARGGRLTALIFRHDRMIQGAGHEHDVRRATVSFAGLEELTGPEPIALEVFTVSTVIVRAPQATDGLEIPAIVSPDLAATAEPGGALALHVANDSIIPLRVVATAERVPTVVDQAPRFVVVPLDPFLVALGNAVPGAGRPSEVWIGSPNHERLAEVRARLADPPFRFAQIRERADLVARSAGDPLSQSVLSALLAAALIGLTLAVGGLVLGAISDLRDETGQLADLETQGMAPSGLRWHVLARSGWLAIGGGVAGVAVGVVLSVLVTAVLALTPEGTVPIPPLVPVVPVVPIVVATVAIVGLVLAVVAAFVARTFGRSAPGQRGAGGRRAPEAWYGQQPEHRSG